MTDNLIIIGFDSEWVIRDDKANHALNYQYAVKVGSMAQHILSSRRSQSPDRPLHRAL